MKTLITLDAVEETKSTVEPNKTPVLLVNCSQLMVSTHFDIMDNSLKLTWI